MGLFKPDFYRFFAFGFLAGAALVFAAMPGSEGGRLGEGIVPVAEAASAQ